MLAPQFGERVYAAVERIAPAPYVEDMLARRALERGDVARAQMHALRMPASAARSELLARIALRTADTSAAQRYFVDAGDFEAVQETVQATAARNPVGAYVLEEHLIDRLRALTTHPDALADAYWTLGQLATRRGWGAGVHQREWFIEGMRDYRAAIALAPLADKYALAAGAQGLNLHDYAAARTYYTIAIDVNPASAEAYAGLGLAALHQGDRAAAIAYAAKSRTLDPRVHILKTLDDELR